MKTPLLNEDTECSDDEKKQSTINNPPNNDSSPPAGSQSLQNSDSDNEEEQKYLQIKSNKGSVDEYYNQNTIPAKSLKVIKEIISRHYGLILSTTVIGASLGFIIYLFVSYDLWIYILGFVGFICGVILDAKKCDAKKRTKLMVDYAATKEETAILHKKWSQSEDDEFYVQSDFYTPFRGIYRGASRVYKKKNCGAMIFEKKALKRVQEYYGFEIGGGISSFIGFLASLIPTLMSDLASSYGLATLTVLFFTVLAGLIGCIIERELRKWDYLPPINVCVVKRDSIALHDITHVCSVTIGYHMRPLDISDVSVIEVAAIAWFKLVAGVFYVVYSLIKYTIYAFWINSAFTLWIFVTISLAILFHVHLTKYDDLLEMGMWCTVATTFLAILCFIFVSPWYRKEINIGQLSLQQLQTGRIDNVKQRKLFIIFGICVLLLFICSFCTIWVAGDIQNLAHKYFYTNKYKSSVWNKMVCKSQRGNAWPFGADIFDGNNHENVDIDDGLNAHNENDLCSDKNYELLAVSILLLCLLWYGLLATAFWWNYHDKYQVEFSMEGKKYRRKWAQYSYVYVYRKSHTYGGIFKSCYSLELTDSDAQELQNYLNQICPWYDVPKYVGIHPYSLNFVQQFATRETE